MGSVRPILEDWLDREGVKWEYVPNVNLADIILDDETRLNIRCTLEVDYERTMSYGISTENGAIFPPLVIGQQIDAPYSEKFDLIDGIHRLEAWGLLKKKTHGCYVVHYKTPTILDRLRKTVNIVTGGMPLREDVRLEHALVLVHRDKYALVDAAKTMDVTYSKLVDKVATEGVTKVLITYQVPVAERKYTKTFLLMLRAIKSDDIKVEIANLAHKASLNSAEVGGLVDEIKHANSDQERARILDRWKEDMSDRVAEGRRGEIRGPMPAMRRLPQYMKKVLELTEEVEEAKILTDGELRRMLEQMRSLINRLKPAIATIEATLKSRSRKRTYAATKGKTRQQASRASI